MTINPLDVMEYGNIIKYKFDHTIYLERGCVNTFKVLAINLKVEDGFLYCCDDSWVPRLRLDYNEQDIVNDI